MTAPHDDDGGWRPNSELSEFWERRCAHPEFHIVRTRIANGTLQYRRECAVCWHLFGSAVSRHEAGGTFREPDVARRRAYEVARKAEEEALRLRCAGVRASRDAAWREQYDEYLQSDSWYERRRLVMRRAGGMCEACGSARATQVHHRTYKHVFDELLWELAAVCDACHDRVHDRQEEEYDL
jgi:5-methylcytosine-specific restriction endonuclease McrA